MTVKREKCQLGTQHVVYLGYVVGGGQVRPTEDKVWQLKIVQGPSLRRMCRAFEVSQDTTKDSYLIMLSLQLLYQI